MTTGQCPACGAPAKAKHRFCPECGAALRRPADSESDATPPAAPTRGKRSRAIRPWTLNLAGELVTNAFSGAITAATVLVVVFAFTGQFGPAPKVTVFSPTPFEERTSAGPINASAVVPIADSVFLVVDDLTGDAFFELRFRPDGRKEGQLVRRPVDGLALGMVDDLEDATLLEIGGQRFVVAISSLERDEGKQTEAGLVRVRIDDAGTLHGEVMQGFRAWLLARYPELGPGPDGVDVVDIQGLAWDSDRGVLLVGVRNPTRDGAPLVLPLRVRDAGGVWETSQLEGLDPLVLPVERGDRPKGILALARRPNGKGYALTAGNPTGTEKRAALYTWDGESPGTVRRVAGAHFLPEVKPEGIAFGTIGGRAAVVIVDDTGGYYAVWQEDFDL